MTTRQAGWSPTSSVRTTVVTTSSEPEARSRLFDTWSRWSLTLATAPLMCWDAGSVYGLAIACHVPSWAAWIPAISTSGVMLASTQISQQDDLEPQIRRYAGWLAAFAIALGVAIAAVHLVLPEKLVTVPWGWRALIGGLPVAMGGLLWHIVSLAKTADRRQRAEKKNQELHAIELQRKQADADARAKQARIDAERATETRRAAELAHAQHLADIARQTANAEKETAAALERKRNAERKIADQVAIVAAKPSPIRAVPPPAQPVPQRGEKTRAAQRYLLERHRAGDDITLITGTQVDREIGANSFAKKHIKQWVAEILRQEQGAA